MKLQVILQVLILSNSEALNNVFSIFVTVWFLPFGRDYDNACMDLSVRKGVQTKVVDYSFENFSGIKSVSPICNRSVMSSAILLTHEENLDYLDLRLAFYDPEI